MSMASKALDEAFPETPILNPAEHTRDAIHINGGDIKGALERLPSDLAHYGFAFARAHRRYLASKLKVEEVKASSYLDVRETLEDLGKGKVTEAIIESNVSKDPHVRAVRADLVEAEFEREQLRAVVAALHAKREALTSMALLARAEMASNGSFRELPEEERRGVG